jgi:hypothetical protein
MKNNISSIKLITIAVVAYSIAFFFQHFIIYKLLIIPQLPAIKSVPLLWWASYMLPIIIVSMLAGFWSKNLRELIITSLIVAMLYNVIIYFLAKSNEPGYLKAYEGAFVPSFIEGVSMCFIVLFMLLFLGRAGKQLFIAFKNK